jgi:RNA polymerase sigma factor (sigma-70 family)
MKASIFSIGEHADALILDRIRSGDEEALVVLFESNRHPILSFVSKNSGSRDDADDLLQEALVILWERVRSGRFEHRSRLSTFIYAVARNLWSQRLRRKGHEVSAEIDPEEHPDLSPSVLEMMIEAEHVSTVRDALQKIGEQCRNLLLLFYWEELSMNEIAERLGFANAETAKAKKYQCKKSLEKVLGELEE